jgi:hypothetical protein
MKRMKWLRLGDTRNGHRISVGKHVGRNWVLDEIIQYSFSSHGFSYHIIHIHTFWLLYTSLSTMAWKFMSLALWKCTFMFLWKHVLLSAILLVSLSQSLFCAGCSGACVCVCARTWGLISLIACSILTLYNFDSFVILTLQFMSGIM